MMRVRVTDDAKTDLLHIKAFISEDNASAAEGVIERIRKTLTFWPTVTEQVCQDETFPCSIWRRRRAGRGPTSSS